MDKSSLCRICLVDNLRMYCIHNTNLQETYERLTGLPFVTEDSRPLQVCYICCAKLRNSYNLQTSCLETEELLTGMLELDQLQPMNDAMQLSVQPIINWTNVSISPEDVPVDIIIDDNDDDDDDVIFCDDNHNLDVDVKVEAMEDNNKRTKPNDTTSLNSTLEDDIEIRSDNTPVIDLCTDSNTEVTDIHTESNNSDVSLLDKVKTNAEDVITDNDSNKNTAKDDIIKCIKNIKRRISYDSPRLDISIVKGNVVQEIVSIDYTEPIGPKVDVNNSTNSEIDSIDYIESNHSNILNDNPVVVNTTMAVSALNAESRIESNLIENKLISNENTVDETIGIENTLILDIDTAVITLDSDTTGSKEHSLSDNDINTICSDQNKSKNIDQITKHAEANITVTGKAINLLEDTVNTEITKSKENNIKEVIGVKNTEPLVSTVDVNTTANTIVTIELPMGENEGSASEETTIEHELSNAGDQNSSDKNTRQIVKTKLVVVNDNYILDDTTTDTAMLAIEEKLDSIECKTSSVPNLSNSKNICDTHETEHVKSNINPIIDTRNVGTDTTMIAGIENADSRKEQNTIEHEINSIPNSNNSAKHTRQIIENEHVRSDVNPLIDTRNVGTDTTMTARVENTDITKEKLKNSAEHNITSVSNSDDPKNIGQVNEIQHVKSNIIPTVETRNIVADTTKTARVENNDSNGEINSLEENSTKFKHKDLKRSNDNNVGQVIKIKHRKPIINPTPNTTALVANTTARLENEDTRKEIDSLKKSSKHESNIRHTDRNRSGKNVGQIIKIKRKEPQIISKANANTANTLVNTTQIDTVKLAVSDKVCKEKENSMEHERSSLNTDKNSFSKNIAQVIEIKHKKPSVSTKTNNTDLPRVENEGFNKEESILNIVHGDTNCPVKNTKEIIETNHTETSYTPISANNIETDNIIARVENEISKIADNSLKDNPLYMLMHVALNCAANPNRFRENNEKFVENTHTIDTNDLHAVETVANDAIMQKRSEKVKTIKEANSLKENQSEIKHAEPKVKHIAGDKNVIHNTTKTASAENSNKDSMKVIVLENELSSSSNANKSAKNIRPVIAIKHVEPKLTSTVQIDTNNIAMIVENENSGTENNSLNPNSIETEINKKLKQVIELKHKEVNVSTVSKTIAATTITKENNTQLNKTNTLENDVNTKQKQNIFTKNNNQKVICIKHIEKIDKIVVNKQKPAFVSTKVNDTITSDNNKGKNHIITQKNALKHKEIENNVSNNIIESKMNEIVNDYAVLTDVFRCDDIYAVEGNFLGQEVIIDSSEHTEVSNNDIDVNMTQEHNKDVQNNQNVNKEISKECPIISTLLNKDCNHKVNTADGVHSIGHLTEIDNGETKNINKINNVNVNNDVNNKICVEIGLNRKESIQNCDNKSKLQDIEDESVEINVVDDIEEKYSIETDFSDTNDVGNKKNCLKQDSPSKGVFCQDVMVVLNKMELNGKTSENLNTEAENKEIRKRDHWNRKNTRKRKSSVLKESTHTGNTRKYNKKKKFTHKNDKEIDIKPYICSICHKSFILKHHLIEHNRKHTGEKPYKCDICEQRFYYQNVLNNHVVTHSGKRPHKCNICGKCYGLKVNLMRHIRVHTCEKPYKCNICGKFFGYKQHLTTHIRIHTGERPFPCHLCTKRFNQRNNLNTHLRSVHSDSNLVT